MTRDEARAELEKQLAEVPPWMKGCNVLTPEGRECIVSALKRIIREEKAYQASKHELPLPPVPSVQPSNDDGLTWRQKPGLL
jgi:hypothetical protein